MSKFSQRKGYVVAHFFPVAAAAQINRDADRAPQQDLDPRFRQRDEEQINAEENGDKSEGK